MGNTKEQPLNVEEMLDVEASEKNDLGVMDDSAINDETNSEKMVTLEENLEVISCRENCMSENTNDKMSSKSNEEVNEKSEVGLGAGDNNVVLQTKDSENKK